MSGESDEIVIGRERMLSAERVAAAMIQISEHMRMFEGQMINLSITKEELGRKLSLLERRMYRYLRELNVDDEDTRRLSEFIFEKQRICDRWSILITRFQ